jgi:L-rhamnose mutarotase
MQRIGRWGRLKAGSAEEYVKLHREMDAALREVHSKAGIKNYTIYRRGLDLFSYLETEDWEAALAYLNEDPNIQKWHELMRTLLDDPVPWPLLDEVFHID